jgi:hypothetical protein
VSEHREADRHRPAERATALHLVAAQPEHTVIRFVRRRQFETTALLYQAGAQMVIQTVVKANPSRSTFNRAGSWSRLFSKSKP